MSQPSAAMLAGMSALLVERNGFQRRGNTFALVNELARSVQLKPMHPYPGHYNFDIELRLGIPGISSFSSKDQEFVVRASLQQACLRIRPSAVTFDLHGDPVQDQAVVDAVIGALDEVCGLFLLRFDSAEQFADFVRDEALDFRDRRMASEGTFRLLKLQPWNLVPRLELAAVYAAFLGRDEANALAELACSEALNSHVAYAIPRIKAHVQAARDAGKARMTLE